MYHVHLKRNIRANSWVKNQRKDKKTVWMCVLAFDLNERKMQKMNTTKPTHQQQSQSSIEEVRSDDIMHYTAIWCLLRSLINLYTSRSKAAKNQKQKKNNRHIQIYIKMYINIFCRHICNTMNICERRERRMRAGGRTQCSTQCFCCS